MIAAKDAVVWVNHKINDIKVKPHAWGCTPQGRAETRGGWHDPIGASYVQWEKMTDEQRTRLMEETALDLAMQGFSLKRVLTAFAEVRQFRALGERSYPMCRALTSALIGQCLEPETMDFEELLVHYAEERVDA